MAADEQVKRIKCPHCGWVRRVPVGVIEDASTATVVRGKTLKSIVEKIRALLADSELDAVNAWIDMPACPHCGNGYRYNARTGAVRR